MNALNSFVKNKNKNIQINNQLYIKKVLKREIVLEFKMIDNNVKNSIENIIKKTYEYKCSVEGYIKPNSCKLINYSTGICKGSNIIFEVEFECLVCCPKEGDLLECVAKNITQAGIRCMIFDNQNISPVVIYLSKDHNIGKKGFTNIKEDDVISIKVIGQRYELNDRQVSLIGELVEKKILKKPKLTLID